MQCANPRCKAASQIAINFSIVASMSFVDLGTHRDKVQTFIFERNRLQNQENCGFAATE
jgi:hypothetical protein